MARKDKANIANGILSVLVTVAGIVMSILIGRFVRILNKGDSREGNTDLSYATSPLWAIGFLFMIPGFFGVVASVAHKKPILITHLVMGIVGLGMCFPSFSVGMRSATTRPMFDGTLCNIDVGTCSCGTDYQRTLEEAGFTCDEIADVTKALLGIDAMSLIGGVLLLISTVLSGRYICCVRDVREDSQGVLINNAQPLAYIETPVPMGSKVNPCYMAQPGFAARPPTAGPPSPPPEY